MNGKEPPRNEMFRGGSVVLVAGYTAFLSPGRKPLLFVEGHGKMNPH